MSNYTYRVMGASSPYTPGYQLSLCTTEAGANRMLAIWSESYTTVWIEYKQANGEWAR